MILLACLVCLGINLLGFMAFVNIHLDQVSSVIILMTFGLAVDYVAHIVHSFVKSSSRSPLIRLEDALADVGGSVLLGGLTSFIGVLPLAFTSANVFQVFFKMFVLIIMGAIFYGFVIAPIAMLYCTVPPKARGQSNQPEEVDAPSRTDRSVRQLPTTGNLSPGGDGGDNSQFSRSRGMALPQPPPFN